jgi:glycerol-3-phosphate dehydrogenase
MVDGKFLPGTNGLMIPKTSDGRVLFALPWHGKTIIGTTDQPVPSKSLEPVPTEDEISFILQNASRYLEQRIGPEHIRSRFAGLRPLAASANNHESTKEISRGHKVIMAPSGLISVIGGKWTTYRRMAQDTLDTAIYAGMLSGAPCRTASLHLHGYTPIPDEDHVLSVYGQYANDLRNMREHDPELAKKIHPELPYTYAELQHALHYEMAETIEDLLLRRTRCLLLDAKATLEAAPAVAKWMAAATGKTPQWETRQVQDLQQLAKNYCA